jgi:transcriptional regulator with XRE-family HTH domain
MTLMNPTTGMLNIRKMEERRKALSMSQHEAALRAGLAGRQAWNNIVSGRRSNITLDTLQKIAEALKYDPRKLITMCRGGRG